MARKGFPGLGLWCFAEASDATWSITLAAEKRLFEMVLPLVQGWTDHQGLCDQRSRRGGP